MIESKINKFIHVDYVLILSTVFPYDTDEMRWVWYYYTIKMSNNTTITCSCVDTKLLKIIARCNIYYYLWGYLFIIDIYGSLQDKRLF